MVFSSDVPAETPSIWPTATVATAAAEQPRTLAGRRYRTGADRRDCGREVRQYAWLREHGGRTDMAAELLDLAVAHVPEVGGRDVELGPARWIMRRASRTAPGRCPESTTRSRRRLKGAAARGVRES